MKREIKFRGKRIDNGEWVYGMPTFDFMYLFNGEQFDSADNYRIDPETVGQFTGIQDVTGDDIYEGDILEVHGNRYKDCRGVVKFIQGAYWLVFVNDDLLSIKEAEEYWDIIGNIHDNPELLK